MRMWRKGTWLIALLLARCGGSNPQPVSPEEFYSRHTVSEAPMSVTDQPGAVPQRDVQAEPPAPPLAPLGGSAGISEGVRRTFPQPSEVEGAATRPSVAATTNPTTGPTTLPATRAALPGGQYMELGTVVAVVNGTPIFANKVIRRDAAVLGELARQYDLPRFQLAARDRIDKTTQELVYDELRYAAAERTLESKDKELAAILTERWRTWMINEAGGSLEVARRRALAQGEEFNEQVEDQHRFYLVQIYLTRKIEPRVQVTAGDMRRYYQANLETRFSKRDRASVWIIHTDSSDLGRKLAQDKINDFRRRALAGEDMAALAKLQNSPLFAEPRTIERHSFALTHVEDAIWKMNVGEVSDVIEDRGGFYIVKLISRENGGVRSFEDEAVQDEIRQTLHAQQLRQLEQEDVQRLLENAVVHTDPQMIDAAVLMAMQNYPRWAKP